MTLLLMAIVALTDPGLVQDAPRRDPPVRERPRSAPPPREVYFANCTAARAAGRQNIRRGEPGYRPPLDRDNDGIACESR